MGAPLPAALARRGALLLQLLEDVVHVCSSCP
jgi:hypothetical protein